MSPTLELQGAITSVLKTALAATTVESRVYDDVPRVAGQVTAQYPFVAHSSSDEVQDDADCIDSVEITYEIDVWSRKPGFREALEIAEIVRNSLHRAELTIVINALVSIEHVQTRKIRDPDGLTSRAIVEFRALIETP